jgi:archaemetzincin
MVFQLPEFAERIQAIGCPETLPPSDRKALDPGDDFESIRLPKPGDWLAEHEEPGQTFEDFTLAPRNVPDRTRNKVYLQPLGEFPEDGSPSLDILKEYAAAFFMLEVEMLPALDDALPGFTNRVNHLTGTRQILTADVLADLKTRLPRDGFCLLAITMKDLYPHPSWNFVFGQAAIYDRVGVFSFIRYDPAFYGGKRDGDYQRLILERSCKVLTHEIGHMLSLAHCIFFQCAMNGSNSLQESDSRPFFLCPACLHKMQSSIGFDYLDRYGKLLHFYQKAGFEEQARWVAERRKKITGAAAGE